MRRSLLGAGALLAVLALAVSGVAEAKPQQAVDLRVGNLELSLNGGLTPEKISKTRWTPVSLNVTGEIGTTEELRPPPLRRFVLEGDRDTSVDVGGLPVCTADKLRSRDTAQAEAICGPAMLGSGEVTVSIEFVELAVPVTSKIVAFSGGVSGGIATILIHAYLEIPRPAAVVSAVRVKGVRDGRYGVKAVASIPPIVAEAGSVTDFDLTIRRRGVVSAKCADGKINARGMAVFGDGSNNYFDSRLRVPWSTTRTCAAL